MLCLLLSGISLVPSASASQATDPSLDGMARKIASALETENARKVAVFDFAGPDRKLTELGRDLAWDFCQSLQRETGTFNVIDRAEIYAVIRSNRLAPGIVRFSDVALWLSLQLKVDAFMVGSVIPTTGKLSVGVAAIQVKSGKVIAESTDSIPFSDRMNTLLAIVITPTPGFELAQEPPANGAAPKCIHCPSPVYSGLAAQEGIEGTLVLSGIVGLDGHVRDIDIAKALSHGLNEQAIAVVETWTFVPAKSADGKSVELEALFEVKFRR